jgi:hypothetical protein
MVFALLKKEEEKEGIKRIKSQDGANTTPTPRGQTEMERILLESQKLADIRKKEDEKKKMEESKDLQVCLFVHVLK